MGHYFSSGKNKDLEKDIRDLKLREAHLEKEISDLKQREAELTKREKAVKEKEKHLMRLRDERRQDVEGSQAVTMKKQGYRQRQKQRQKKLEGQVQMFQQERRREQQDQEDRRMIAEWINTQLQLSTRRHETDRH